MITQIQLIQTFDYDAGNLIWRVQRGRQKPGNVAGSKNATGYIYIRFANQLYLAHRLIYLYHHGYMPDYIDHIDRNPSNNRIENLRPCSVSENQQNRTPTTGKNGYMGVWQAPSGRFYAQIVHQGQCHNLGTYDTAEQAFEAYCRAKEQFHSFHPV